MIKNKKLIGLLALLIVLLIGTGVYFFIWKNDESVIYSEIKVKRGDLLLNVNATGLVSPQNRLEIKPPVAGRIEEVLVREGDVVKKSTTLAWISSNERAALLDSVRTLGKSEIKRWEQLYRPTPVIAPIDGTVILRNVETGQSFTSVDPIFVMADRLTVKAQVDETDIAQIKKGQKATIVLDAYPDRPIEGNVVHVAYDATLTNNVTTYMVDVLPESVPEFMRSGMTSNVSIHVARKDNVLLIPVFTLIQNESGVMVLALQNEKKNLIPVKVGMDDGRLVEIVEGLVDNDVVVVKETGSKKKKKTSNPLFPGTPRGGSRGGKR